MAGQVGRRDRKFLENHPLGAAVSDINIAAALLCCEGVELAEIRDNPGRRNEAIFVLKGDKDLLARRALQFFSGRVDGKKLSVAEDGMKLVAQFSAKTRELKAAIKNGLRGKVPSGV